MNRAVILDLLTQHSEPLRDRFRAKHLALFGSAARDELREDSEIDVLVDFEEHATLRNWRLYLDDSIEGADKIDGSLPVARLNCFFG